MNDLSRPVSNLAAIDAAHHLHPFSDMGKLNATGTRIIERAEGVFIYDSTGKKYLDAFAGSGASISAMVAARLPKPWRGR